MDGIILILNAIEAVFKGMAITLILLMLVVIAQFIW